MTGLRVGSVMMSVVKGAVNALSVCWADQPRHNTPNSRQKWRMSGRPFFADTSVLKRLPIHQAVFRLKMRSFLRARCSNPCPVLRIISLVGQGFLVILGLLHSIILLKNASQLRKGFRKCPCKGLFRRIRATDTLVSCSHDA